MASASSGLVCGGEGGEREKKGKERGRREGEEKRGKRRREGWG